jgi:hypothetical protein
MSWYRVFVHKVIITTATWIALISDRMAYMKQRSRWCDIVVLNVHAPTEGKIDGVKDSFYEDCNVYSVNSLNAI